jgi:hypothetical protein
VSTSDIYDIALCSFYVNDVSEESITSIFRVENNPSRKACTRWLARWSTYGLHGAVFHKMAAFVTSAVRTSFIFANSGEQ